MVDIRVRVEVANRAPVSARGLTGREIRKRDACGWRGEPRSYYTPVHARATDKRDLRNSHCLFACGRGGMEISQYIATDNITLIFYIWYEMVSIAVVYTILLKSHIWYLFGGC